MTFQEAASTQQKEKNTFLYWNRPGEPHILTREEQHRLTTFLRGNLTPIHTGLLLSLYAGLRAGEICALQWEDVNDQYIYVHRSMKREKAETGAGGKTQLVISELDDPRDVPLPGAFLPCLGEKKKSGFVVTGIHGGPVEPRFLDVKFKDAIKKCGIENVNFHSLRDTFAVRCIEMGVDMLCLSEILGHASVNHTVRSYGTVSDIEEKRLEMEKISSLLPY